MAGAADSISCARAGPIERLSSVKIEIRSPTPAAALCVPAQMREDKNSEAELRLALCLFAVARGARGTGARRVPNIDQFARNLHHGESQPIPEKDQSKRPMHSIRGFGKLVFVHIQMHAPYCVRRKMREKGGHSDYIMSER